MCFYPKLNESKLSLALLILRIIGGVAFIFHGWGKIQNPFGWMGADSEIPGILQALAALSEFGGGIAWVVGLFTPLASFGLLCTMAVATWFHYSQGDPFVSTGGASYELAAVYFAISLLLMFVGAGRYSLDKIFFNRNS